MFQTIIEANFGSTNLQLFPPLSLLSTCFQCQNIIYSCRFYTPHWVKSISYQQKLQKQIKSKFLVQKGKRPITIQIEKRDLLGREEAPKNLIMGRKEKKSLSKKNKRKHKMKSKKRRSRSSSSSDSDSMGSSSSTNLSSGESRRRRKKDEKLKKSF